MTEDDTTDEVDRLQDRLEQARTEVQRRLVGQERVLDQILASLLADGNALLESTPGLGKTMLVRTLAEVTDMSFSRIQNTPDLMPSDITGTEIIQDTREGREFTFEPGPVFANVVLADEINRATPKTQAALLEAMQERQVTAGGETRELPDPFFVLATQNPIEQEGSLHPAESVYMDGQLWTASEALEHAKTEGELVHDSGSTKLYDVDATTQALTPDGEMTETECLVYETEYEGEIYTFETKTGRTIEVSGNHPFLVNCAGVIRWKKASELESDDALVTPAELSLPTRQLGGHETALTQLESNGYTVVRRDELRRAKARLDAGEPLDVGTLDALRIAADLSKKDLAERADVSYDRVCNFFQGVDNGIDSQLADTLQTLAIEVGDYVEAFTRHRIDDRLSGADAGFFVGFVLAEGHLTDKSLDITQKNLSEAFDRWVAIAEDIGLDVTVESHPTGRVARIDSKPFVDYLDERFHLQEPERLLTAPEDFRRAFLEIFLLTESHYDTERRRITFVQKDRETTNLIAHLLLGEGIVPWVYERDDRYELRIQGEDTERYVERFEWRGEVPDVTEFESAHRTIPLSADDTSRLVSVLGMKYDGALSERPWYNSYAAVSDRGRMAVSHFDTFLRDVESTLEERKLRSVRRTAENDIQSTARACGLSMTDIVDETSLTKHRVWQAYQSEAQPREATEYVVEEYTSRIEEAEALTEYYRNLADGEVFFDRITSIDSRPYDGPVIGLSVPEHHNYVAGLGGCGISHNTYPLPEAQTDRFLTKILVDYPGRDAEREIVDRYTGRLDADIPVEQTLSRTDLVAAQEYVRQVPIADDLTDRAVDLVRATREADRLEYGASPRASMGLVVLAKARAFMHGRNHVESEDIEAMAPPVLRHRVVVDFQAERDGVTPDEIIRDLL
jgi:MoxR-like ATPase/transcriptional regulator with XRE-family HTH domain